MSYQEGLINTILFSFDNGITWVDVSEDIKWDTLEVSIRAMNNEFKSAQNEASFQVIYEPTLYSQLRNATEDFLVVMQHISDGNLGAGTLGNITLNQTTLGNANSNLDNYQIFTGHASYALNRTYNGILDNTIIQITATDSGDLLDVPCGDIVYRSTTGNVYQISNPSNTSLSIVHQLVIEAGFPVTKVSPNLVIPYEIPVDDAFAPITTEDSIKELIDTLLHEYGYVMYFDEFDELNAVKWILDSSAPVSHTFTDVDTLTGLSESRATRQYNGVEVTYYEHGLGVTTNPSNDTLVYRDSNFPYGALGGWEGLTIPAGAKYPFETGVIDETTGTWQVVEQEYTNDGISYFTNKAVVNKLDYNIDAFSSDFSSIIATYDHRYEYEVENSAIQLFATPIFGNKKAQMVFKNTSTTTDYDMYYLAIYAKMIYKTGERKSRNSVTDNDRKIYKYESKFLATKELADRYTNCRALQYQEGNSTYSFRSLERYTVGSFVRLTLNDGTDDRCLIMERSLDNSTGIWTYVIKKYSISATAITSQKVTSLSTLTQTTPVAQAVESTNAISADSADFATDATNAVNVDNNNGVVEGSIRQISTDGGIKFYKYTSGIWEFYGGFNADNIQFEEGDASIVLGYFCMPLSSTAESCVIIGNQAGQRKTSGDNDVYIGRNAGTGSILSFNTGSNNIGIGTNALRYTTSGNNNIALGTNAMLSSLTSLRNVALGYDAGRSATDGTGNIIIGDSALKASTYNDYTVAIGTDAMGFYTTSQSNTAVGYSALPYGSVLSTNNVAVGSQAGMALSGGGFNTLSSSCIYIGSSASGHTVTNQTNMIVIGANARGYGSNTAHIGNSSVTTISYGPATGTAFTNRSDPRLKEDIEDANLEICYNTVKSLPLKRYKYKNFVCQNPIDKHVTGFLSTDVKKVFPKAVEAKDIAFPILDENNNIVMKTITRTMPNGEVVEIEVEDTFIVKDCESITMNELVPQLFGSVQYLMNKIENMQTIIDQLKVTNGS